MISKDTVLSEVFDWEKILDGGYVTWLLVQKDEETFVQSELKKTVGQFIGSFRTLVLEICRFDHERADGLRHFTECPFFWINFGCGHPRIMRTKFCIALRLLLLRKKINEDEFDDYRDDIYGNTGALTSSDFQATKGYREEYSHRWIQIDSTTGQKLAAVQVEFGTKLLSLRDEIVGKLEAAFLD